jgi:hypothetical protein
VASRACRACGDLFAKGRVRRTHITVALCRTCARDHVWYVLDGREGERHVAVMRDGVEPQKVDLGAVVVRLRYWAAAARRTAKFAPVVSAAPEELAAHQEGRAEGLEAAVEALRAAFFNGEELADLVERLPPLAEVLEAISEGSAPRVHRPPHAGAGGLPVAQRPVLGPPEATRRPPPPAWPRYTYVPDGGPAVSRLEQLRRRARGG